MRLVDKRLDAVMDTFTERICQRPHLVIRKLAYTRSEEIQFGRFIANPRVQVTDLEKELLEQYKRACPEQGHILLIEDTTQLAFGLGRKIAELGKVDKGQVQGFYLHPVLALGADNGACYGIASTSFIKRDFDSEEEEKPTLKQRKAARDKEAFEDKEAYRWYSSIASALQSSTKGVKKTVVADREADIYAVLTGLEELGVDYVIRCRHNRPLEDGQKLYELVDKLSEQYRFSVPVPATDKRSAHTAVLKVKFGEVVLKKPSTKSNRKLAHTHTCRVIKVEEDSCSVQGKEAPIEWLLFTSHQVETADDALKIIGYYKQRWNIEQVFRTLKGKGLNFEASRLSNYEKLQKLLLIALRASVKILQMVRARDGSTGQKMDAVFTESEAEFIVKLNTAVEGNTEKLKNPHPPQSLAFAAWVIARLAGWSGYQTQRPPGPIDYFVGLQRFEERYQGYLIAKSV